MKRSTVAPRTFNFGAWVAMDGATVVVTDACTSGTAAAVGAGIGAGAGAARTSVADAARARTKEEMHCILAVWLVGWSGVCV